MEFAFLWIACAFFSAIVAGAKGRNVMGWFFLGLIFGILALLAVGFMPSARRRQMEPQRSSDPVYRNGRWIPADEALLQDIEKQGWSYEMSTAGRESRGREEIECPFCAEIILKKAKVCKHCGRDIVVQAEAASANAED